MLILLYFYRFNQIREDQAVVSCDTIHNIFTPGVLLQEWRDFLLCLGEEVSRPELVSARYSFVDPKVIVQLCQDTTIDMIHQMVYEWFSSYKDVTPLFFWSDIELLLKHKPIEQKKNTTSWQILHIFPSLFALTQFVGFSEPKDKALILSWQTTPVQRAKHYRAIQSGQIQHIFATHSQIFWDWYNLQEINFHDEYSPFYAVHAEPRYTVPMVVKKMKEMIR